MATLSLASDLAWRFAANEALALGSTVMEPAHLLIGILSLEKVFSPELAERLKITEYGLSSLRVEWAETLRAVAVAGSSPATLRREVREELPREARNPATDAKPKVSRSERCKQVFVRVGEIAEAAGSTVVGLRYLLFALLDAVEAGFAPSIGKRLDRIKQALAPLASQPLQPTISSLEEGYVSDNAIEPALVRRVKTRD